MFPRQGPRHGLGAAADDLIRVGNEEYARENGAYGLTTLQNRHAHVSGADIEFMFTGKSGIEHQVHAHDRRIARVLRECQEIRGQRLFQYLDDDGTPTPVHSHDVNEYLRDAAGADITAKDFRTWVATVATAGALGPLDPPDSEREEKALVKEVIEEVAADLGNTPTVCRASYVHPHVLETFSTGALHDAWSTTPPRPARLTLAERRTRGAADEPRRRASAGPSRPHSRHSADVSREPQQERTPWHERSRGNPEA